MEKTNQITAAKLLEVLRSCWIWMIVAALLVGVAAGACGKFFISDEYTCSMKCMIGGVDNVLTTSELSQLTKYVNRSAEVFKTKTVIDRVTEKANVTIGDRYAYSEMRSATSVAVNADTGTYTIKVTTNSKEVSMAMILSFYELHDTIVEENGLNAASVIERSHELPSVPSNSGRFTKFFLLGALAGAVILYLIFFIKAILDVTIRSENDLKKYTDLPVLGQIPKYSGAVESGDQILNKAKPVAKG